MSPSSRRATAWIVVPLGLLAMLAGLLPASAQAPPGEDEPTAEAGWTVRDAVDTVDMAAFAREHATEFSATAPSADPAAERAARDRLQALYGGAAEGGTAPAFQIEQQRTEAVAHQYYDECDDGSNLPGEAGPPPQLDLRSAFMVQTADDLGRLDQTGFLAYTCRPWATAALGAGGITWGLYISYEREEEDAEYPTILGDPEVGPDFLVSIFPEPNVPSRPLQVMAVRTPSRDPSTWTLTWLADAQRIDEFEADGVVPTSAIGDISAEDSFAWTWAVTDSQPGPAPGRDWFPEDDYRLAVPEQGVAGQHIPQFPVPEECGLQTESTRIEYTLEPQQVATSDPAFPHQWALRAVRAPQAWATIADSGTGGRSRPVTVAVIDTGIDGPRHDFVDPIARVTVGYDAVYGLELAGVDNGGTIGAFTVGGGVAYENMGARPRNSDRGPHGTAVASLIGARGNNGQGIAGMDWGVRLMPVRVNDVNNCITNVDVAEGILWAVDRGADIVNISLGGLLAEGGPPADEPIEVPECQDGLDNDNDGQTDYESPNENPNDDGCTSSDDGSESPEPACSDGRDNDEDGLVDFEGGDPHCASADDDLEGNDGEGAEFDPMRVAVDYALEQGVPVVASAGNAGLDEDPVFYPAAYPGVITVGSTTRAGAVPAYSSTGRWLDLVAPGGDARGGLVNDLAALWELDRIRPVAGTSFSAAQVSGAMALYLGLNPHIARAFTPLPAGTPPGANPPDVGYQRTVDDLRVALINAARNVGVAGHDLLSGHGLLDVDMMLDIPAVGGPLIDPARAQLPRVDRDVVAEITEEIALDTAPAEFAVLTRSDVHADALAGAPLTGGGPLLATTGDALRPQARQVMREILPDGATVYLLGGEHALSAAVEDAVREDGFTPVRLSGPTRLETAVAIGQEVRRLWPDAADEVVLARADGLGAAAWADAVTGGAWAADSRVPVLLTGSEELAPVVRAVLDDWAPSRTLLMGGEAALSADVLAAAPNAERVAGVDRADTAVAVAEELWDDADGYLVVNGWYQRGWVAALAAARMAAEHDAPVLLVRADGVPDGTAALLADACPGPDDVVLIGGASLLTGTVETSIAEEGTCG